jgi:hypothetical protein
MTSRGASSNVAICTIASANYTAYAKTLADSVHKYEPSVSFFLLVVDRKTPQVEAAIVSTGLNAVYAEDLGLSDFERLALKFDIVELNTALKPTMLKRMFSQGFEKVLYLDPDIRLFSDLSPVLDALDHNNIVFTPHSQTPVMDGYRPSDIDFLRAGVFNLGFVGLRASQQTSQMLEWWEDRCLAYGFIDTALGIFVDQKWMNLVPCYYDGVYILKHLGCNVAYWNLHERQVVGERGNYTVGGVPLCFFHFSGVKANEPEVLSRHQTRHKITPATPLAELVADYCQSLNGNGQKEFSSINYTFSHFDNGVSINNLVRRAACFEGPDQMDIFSSEGKFYKLVQRSGLLVKANKKNASLTTINFDESSFLVRTTNRLLRLVSRIIGSDRLNALTRYMSVLAREDNLARVLSKTPFDFAHTHDKTRRY